MNRRTFLAMTGGMVLAGCSETNPPHGGDTSTENSKPRWLSEVPLNGWTMRRGDQYHTGRAPNANLSLSETPQVRWETTVAEHDMRDIIATEYGVFTGSGEGTSTVVFRRNPTKNHRITAGGSRGSEPAIRDGVLYFGGSSVSAIDVVSDRVNWSTGMASMPGDKAEAPVPIHGTPAVDNDAVYAIGMRTRDAVSLFALNSADGSFQWQHDLVSAHLGIKYEPVLIGDHLVAVVPDPGTDALTITAVNRASGSEQWQQAIPIPNGYDEVDNESFTPVAAGEQVVFRLNNTVYAVDLQTGDFKWEYHSEHGQVVSPIAADDYIYAATRSGEILALDHQTGDLAWITSIEGHCSEPVAVADEHLVAVSQRENGKVKGIYPPATVTTIEKATGDHHWTFEHEGTAQAPVIGGESIFVGFWTVRNGAWSSIAALG